MNSRRESKSSIPGTEWLMLTTDTYCKYREGTLSASTRQCRCKNRRLSEETGLWFARGQTVSVDQLSVLPWDNKQFFIKQFFRPTFCCAPIAVVVSRAGYRPARLKCYSSKQPTHIHHHHHQITTTHTNTKNLIQNLIQYRQCTEEEGQLLPPLHQDHTTAVPLMTMSRFRSARDLRRAIASNTGDSITQLRHTLVQLNSEVHALMQTVATHL